MVARGLGGPGAFGALMRTFVCGTRTRVPGFHPFASRVLDTRSIALSRSSHCVWRRHSSHSLVVFVLHWYDASDALQRTSACCCSGCDRDSEERVEIVPRLDCVNVGYGEIHWVNFDAGSVARVVWAPFACPPPLRSVRFDAFDRIPRARGRRLPSLLWGKPSLHSACKLGRHLPVRGRAGYEPRNRLGNVDFNALPHELHYSALFALLQQW